MSAIPIPHDIESHPLTRMYNGKFGIWLFLASEVMLFGALFSAYVLLRVGAPPGTWPLYGSPETHGRQVLSIPMAGLNTIFLITSSVTMVLAWAALKVHNFNKGRLYLIITFVLAGAFLVVKYFEYKSKFTHYQIVFRDAPGDELKEVVGHVAIPTATGHRDLYYLRGHKTGETEEAVTIVPDPKPVEGHGETAAAGGHAQAGEHEHKAVTIEKSLIKRMSIWGPQASTFLAIYFTITGLHGLHVIGGMVVIGFLILTGGGMWKKMPDKFVNRVECTGLYWHFVDLVWIFLFPILYLL